MYKISDSFKQFAKKNSRYVDIKCNIDGIDYTDITEFNIIKSVSSEDEFQFGILVASRLNIKIRKAKNIASHSLCVPSVRFSTDLGKTYSEWLTLGHFYVDNRYYNDGIVSITAYDKVINLDNIYDSKLTYPATFKDILDEIANTRGFVYDIELDDIKIEVKPIDYTEREMIQYCASCHSASAFFDNDGVLKFNDFTVQDESIDILNATVQSIDDQAYTIRKIDCVKNKDITYMIGESEGDYSTISFINPFMTKDQFEKRYAKFIGFKYYKSTIEKTSFGYYEVADSMKCFDTSELSNIATIIISNIEYSFSSNGLFKEVINSVSRNPSDTDYTKTSDLESIIRNETEQLQDAVYWFENSDVLKIANENVEIIRIRFTAKSSCTPLFNANIIFKIDTEGLLEFEYIIDNIPYRVEPKQSVVVGYHTIHLFLPIYQIDGNQSHDIVVYVRSSNAKGTINKNQIQATINGQGLETIKDTWDGTIQIITEVNPITISNTSQKNISIGKIGTSMSFDCKEPSGFNLVSEVQPISINSIRPIIKIKGIEAGIGYSKMIVDEQIKLNSLTKQNFIYDIKYVLFNNDVSLVTDYIFDETNQIEIDQGKLQELSIDIEQFKNIENITLEVK
uniref:Minor structural protein n=1 Tax=Siphoviridae sp. ctGuJ10 TaxID=2825418 RepID=A0A8S5PUB8_9CAUD|nr:MAG TPA: Minor structural protein [Siphoviridae sp. ctGuJ10]